MIYKNKNPLHDLKCRGLIHLGERLRPSEMGRVGFEPTTNALKGHCSSAELPTQSPPDEIRTRKACANGF